MLTGFLPFSTRAFNLLESDRASHENAILRTQMDVLVLGDFFITERNATPPEKT